MKKGVIIILVIVGIIIFTALCIVGWYVSTHNKLVALNEDINGKWSQVQNQYQRRFDLIPNLVETVKGYAKHEKVTLEEVVNARAKVGQMVISPEVLRNPQAFQMFEKAQGELSSALMRLMAVSENYPNLKANENFLQLQSQLEGTENRIAVERMRFNEAVQNYNTTIKKIPTSIVAGMNGYVERPYFKSQDGAENAPKVNF